MDNYLIRKNYKYFDLKEKFTDEAIVTGNIEDFYDRKKRSDLEGKEKIQFTLKDPIYLTYIYVWPIKNKLKFKINYYDENDEEIDMNFYDENENWNSLSTIIGADFHIKDWWQLFDTDGIFYKKNKKVKKIIIESGNLESIGKFNIRGINENDITRIINTAINKNNSESILKYKDVDSCKNEKNSLEAVPKFDREKKNCKDTKTYIGTTYLKCEKGTTEECCDSVEKGENICRNKIYYSEYGNPKIGYYKSCNDFFERNYSKNCHVNPKNIKPASFKFSETTSEPKEKDEEDDYLRDGKNYCLEKNCKRYSKENRENLNKKSDFIEIIEPKYFNGKNKLYDPYLNYEPDDFVVLKERIEVKDEEVEDEEVEDEEVEDEEVEDKDVKDEEVKDEEVKDDDIVSNQTNTDNQTRTKDEIQEYLNKVKIQFILNNFFTDKFEVIDFKSKSDSEKKKFLHYVNVSTLKGKTSIVISEVEEEIKLVSPMSITYTSGYAIILYAVLIILIILMLII